MLLMAAFLAGCATDPKSANTNMMCATVGGLGTGAVAGAAVAGGPGAVGGAVAGGILSLLLCQEGEPEPAPAPEPVKVVCPLGAPEGALLDANGCAFDSDKDGVVDGIDMCQNTPEGVAVDLVGCALDEDKDAVPDYKDQCLGTPLGTIVDETGCPVVGETVLSLTGVNFDLDKAVLKPQAKVILDEAVASLKAMSGVDKIRVEGHTDSTGSASYNMALSQRRAKAVVAYLVANGIEASRLQPVGMGEGFPVATNDTKAGRALNRRVDFVVCCDK
jgi:OOP family OmpA-OmpF porin